MVCTPFLPAKTTKGATLMPRPFSVLSLFRIANADIQGFQIPKVLEKARLLINF